MQLHRITAHCVAAGAVVLLSACGDDTAETASGDAVAPVSTAPSDTVPAHDELMPVDVDQVDGEWIVVEMTLGGEVVDLLDDAPITITMTIEGDRISGVAACNSFGAAAEFVSIGGGGNVVLDGVEITEMGCEPAVMAIESAFLDVIGQVDSYEVTGGMASDGLVLSIAEPESDAASTSLVLERQASAASSGMVDG